METIEISSHADLLLRIAELKEINSWQDAEFKDTFREFVNTLNPLSMVKESLHELAEDREVQFDLAKVGMNLGANFIIDRILGKHSSIKGFLGAKLVEKISASLINSNVYNIISGIGRLIHRKPKQAIGAKSE